MEFTFTVNVTVEREEGLFASRDDIGEQIREAIDLAINESWMGDHGGTYSTTDSDVEEVAQPKRRRVR